MEMALHAQREQTAQELLSEARKYCFARCSEDIRRWEKFVQVFIAQLPAFDILLDILNQPHLFTEGALQLLAVTSVTKLYCVSVTHQPVSQQQLTLLCQRQQQYASIASSPHPEARIYAQVAEQLLLSAAGVLCVSCLSQLSCNYTTNLHSIVSNMHAVCITHIQCLQTLLPLPDLVKLLTFWPEWITYNRVKQFIHFNVAEKRSIVDQFRLFFVIAAYDCTSQNITMQFQTSDHAQIECVLHVAWLSLLLDVSQPSTHTPTSQNNNNLNNKEENNANDNSNKNEDKESWKSPLPDHTCCVALLKTLCRDLFRYKNNYTNNNATIVVEQQDTARHSAWVTLLQFMSCVMTQPTIKEKELFSTYWSLSEKVLECVSRYGLLDVSWLLLGLWHSQDENSAKIPTMVSQMIEEVCRDTAVMTCVSQVYAVVSQDWFSVVSSYAATLCDTPISVYVSRKTAQEKFEEVFEVEEEVTERLCRVCRSVSHLCYSTHRSHILSLSPSQLSLLQILKNNHFNINYNNHSNNNSNTKKKTQSPHTSKNDDTPHVILLRFGVVKDLCDTLKHQCETHLSSTGAAPHLMMLLDVSQHVMSIDRFVSQVCHGLFIPMCHKLCHQIEIISETPLRYIAVSRARDVSLCVASMSRKLICDTQPSVEVCHQLHQLQLALQCQIQQSVQANCETQYNHGCITDSLCRGTLVNIQFYFAECVLPLLTYLSRYFKVHSVSQGVSQQYKGEEGSVSYCVTNEFRSTVRDTWRQVCRVSQNGSSLLSECDKCVAWLQDEIHMTHNKGCLSVTTHFLLPAILSSVCLSHINSNNNNNTNANNNVNNCCSVSEKDADYGYIEDESWLHSLSVTGKIFIDIFHKLQLCRDTELSRWSEVCLAVSQPILTVLLSSSGTLLQCETQSTCVVTRMTEHLLHYLNRVMQSSGSGRAVTRVAVTLLSELLLCRNTQSMSHHIYKIYERQVFRSVALLCLVMKLYREAPLYDDTVISNNACVAYVSQRELPFRLKQDNIAAVTLQRNVLPLFLALFKNITEANYYHSNRNIVEDSQWTATQEHILTCLITETQCDTPETHICTMLYNILSNNLISDTNNSIVEVRHMVCLALAQTVSQACSDFIIISHDNDTNNNNQNAVNNSSSMLSLPSAGICVAMFLQLLFFDYNYNKTDATSNNYDNINNNNGYEYVQCVLILSLCHAIHHLSQHMSHTSGVAATAEEVFEKVPGVSQILRHALSISSNTALSRIQEHVVTVSQRLILRHMCCETVSETHQIISYMNYATQLCLGLLCHSMNNIKCVATSYSNTVNYCMCITETVSQMCHNTIAQVCRAVSHIANNSDHLPGVSRCVLLTCYCDTLLSACDTWCVAVNVSRKSLNTSSSSSCIASVSRVGTSLLHTLSLLCQLLCRDTTSSCDDMLCITVSATQAVSRLLPHYLVLHWHLLEILPSISDVEDEIVLLLPEGCEEVFEGVLSPVSRHLLHVLVSLPQHSPSRCVTGVSQIALDDILYRRRGVVYRWLTATRLSTSNTTSNITSNITSQYTNVALSLRVTLTATVSLWTQTLGLYLRYSSRFSVGSESLSLVHNTMKPPSVSLLFHIVESLTRFIQNGFLSSQDSSGVATQTTELKNALCRGVSHLCQIVFLCIVAQTLGSSGFFSNLVKEGLCVAGHISPHSDDTIINESVLVRDLVTVQRLQRQACVCSATPFHTNNNSDSPDSVAIVNGVAHKIMRCLVFLMRDHNNVDNNSKDTENTKKSTSSTGAINSTSVEAATATLGLLALCLGCDTLCRGLLTHWLTFELGNTEYLRDTAEEPIATQCLMQLHGALVTGDWKKATHCVKRLFSAS